MSPTYFAKGFYRLDGELKAGPIEPEASRGAVGVEHGVSGDNNVAANIYDYLTFLHARNVPGCNGGLKPALDGNETWTWDMLFIPGERHCGAPVTATRRS